MSGAVIVVGLATALAAAVAPAAAPASRWDRCGVVGPRIVNGYATYEHLQARDGVRCQTARYIGLHLRSGGYDYRGLTCFYAPMGVGHPYWDWSCAGGRAGHEYGKIAKVRGHSVTQRTT
ncbi:MAG: hypothetical protein JOZ07_18185 [Solirubrobacterales bacterium]|nr:hypothetical protein [Solirubrobacterales bacterium]